MRVVVNGVLTGPLVVAGGRGDGDRIRQAGRLTLPYGRQVLRFFECVCVVCVLVVKGTAHSKNKKIYFLAPAQRN